MQTLFRVILLTLFIGFPMFVSRIVIFRKHLSKKLIVSQFILFIIYVFMIYGLVLYDKNNSSIDLAVLNICFWIGYYIIIEPIISYRILSQGIKSSRVILKEFGLSYVGSTILITFFGLYALMVYAIRFIGLWD